MYDYANILFTGRCNLRCYECIGTHPALRGLPHNTALFPPKNVDALIDAVNRHNIPDLAFTGTNVDPQLYEHEKELIDYIRSRLTSNTKLSLHTNGLRAFAKIDIFNSYDKASISLPSFDRETFAQVTGSTQMPDIDRIVREARIPLKLSMLMTPHNLDQIPTYVQRAAALGIKRVVVRKLKGHDAEYPLERMEPFSSRKPAKAIFGWPVYNIDGVEVTVCGFDTSSARGLFLFSDGRLEDRLV